MNRRSFVYAATPGPDRQRFGCIEFRGPSFTHTALRTAYRIARRSCDPIEARIIIVTAFAGGLGGDPVSSLVPRARHAPVPRMRLVGGS